jgi:hypothetical protein
MTETGREGRYCSLVLDLDLSVIFDGDGDPSRPDESALKTKDHGKCVGLCQQDISYSCQTYD